MKTKVKEIIDSLSPLLPIQNPMAFFVHNNPLQYFERFPFSQGIEKAVLIYENVQKDQARIHWRELEDFVIPLALSYFDQGLNRWTLPEHKKGLWNWYCDYIQSSLSLRSKALVILKKNLDPIQNKDPLSVITSSLIKRCPEVEDWPQYLQTLIFHFKGWSGMVQVLEKNPSVYPLIIYPAALIDWIAILVTAECAMHENKTSLSASQKLWDFSQLEIRKSEIHQQIEQIKTREKTFIKKSVLELQSHIISQSQNIKIYPQTENPEVEILFCLDDREESLRRALESVNPHYETYGTLGFFGIDFSLKRRGHLISQPHCPPVVQPRKLAIEIDPGSSETPQNFSSVFRKLIPLLNESRFTLIEPLLSIVFWPFYAMALILRSFSPNLYYHLRDWLRLDHYLDSDKEIQFITEYTLEEKAQIVSDILGGAGLNQVRSHLVIVLGHAATTTNNPFQKSYGCGACSGQAGYSNAKVFAGFANDLDVRQVLQNKGLKIPTETYFLAACHDTCSDEVHYTSLKSLNYEPSVGAESINHLNQTDLLAQFKMDMNKALEINKKERWKKFNLPTSSSAILRSRDWSQPRPEFGHSRVSLSVFGPRWLTKGLDLSRRAFLVSYEPTEDPEGKHLAFDLLNALPVCANINLDYFTSNAFPKAFGAGSKLPLNIAAGIGLMPGSKGDLRIGLATQMIDQHEPLRLVAYVYADKEKLVKALAQSARLQLILKNNWIHLIRIDPNNFEFEAMTEEIKNDITITQ